MAMEHYFQETLAQIGSNDADNASLEKWKSVSAIVDGSENYSTGGFDCNICLDSVQDPVVTLCGHLYCWPCIYKWIHYQSVSAENPGQQQPQCPVCKAEVSQQTLVPLYGRGQTTKPSEGKAPHLGIVIPRRPPSPRCGFQTPITPTTPTSTRSVPQLHHRGYLQQPQPYYSHPGTPTLSLTGTTTTNVGMLGEMVYARIFGNSESTLYTYPNSYDLAGSSSPRMRRHLVQADKSLSRVCFFFCCCLFLCLLLF